MNLPKIDVPTYTITLPISKLTVVFRPYLVKEQKILSMAKESGEKNSLIDAILQILENCTQNGIDVRELPITDTEYYFYNIRARSESETVGLRYKCENVVAGNKCGNIMEHDLNLLTDLEISDPGVSNVIQISDTVGVKLKHQKFELDNLGDKIPTPKELLELIANNVDFIYDENSQYNAKDIPISKIVDWLGELETTPYEQIEKFFLNEPKIVKNLQITCSKCGMVHDILVEDIFDFFI